MSHGTSAIRLHTRSVLYAQLDVMRPIGGAPEIIVYPFIVVGRELGSDSVILRDSRVSRPA